MQNWIQCRAAQKLLSDVASDETATKTTETEKATEIRRLLNVNACEFVPRAKDDNECKKLTQPNLMLPWKGFPKLPRSERTFKTLEPMLPMTGQEKKAALSLKHTQLDKDAIIALNVEIVGKKPLREKIVIKETPADVKRREQERQVALEALKLVEQRRLREALEEKQPEVIVHLSREPVNFTADERLRVDKLRAIKREQIERVLREMRLELEQKLDRELRQEKQEQKLDREPTKLEPQVLDPQLEQKLDQKLSQMSVQKSPQQTKQRLQTVGRYVALQRAVKKPPEEEKVKAEPQAEPQAEPKLDLEAEQPPRRYIPTAKQWAEHCKAKASANKENYVEHKQLGKSEEHKSQPRAMAPSTQGNIMPSHISQATARSDKDQALFVPRYWPPAPKVASGERRRGNLIHARNIARAFANCGLLPTPTLPGVTPAAASAPAPAAEAEPKFVHDAVRRYDIKQLLELEPQPEQLQVPFLSLNVRQLGFLGD